MRRVRHAWRSTGAHRVEDRGSARAPRAGRTAAVALRHGRVRNRSLDRAGGSPRAGAHNECGARLTWLRQLQRLGRQHEAGAEAEPGGLLGVEPRPARGTRGDAGAGRRPGASLRGDRCRSPAPAMQPAARGDGAVRVRGHADRRGPARGGRITSGISGLPDAWPRFPSGHGRLELPNDPNDANDTNTATPLTGASPYSSDSAVPALRGPPPRSPLTKPDRKSTRLNSSH